jgi:3-oxoacyl-[acyl-carrier protein] reductase
MDRVALVTGASRGIGKAIAIGLGQAGCHVVINYRSGKEAAEETQREISKLGKRTMLVQADVSKREQVHSMVQAIEKEFGRIDILVNNAGIANIQKIEEISEADWDELIDVNLKSTFLVTQAVLAGMRARKWGRILNIASLAAQAGGIVGPHYSASKAGMIGITHYVANVFMREGITANALAPAVIQSWQQSRCENVPKI